MKKLLSSALTCAIAGSLLVAPAAHADDQKDSTQVLLRIAESTKGSFNPETNKWSCVSEGEYIPLTEPNSRVTLTGSGPCTREEYETLLDTALDHLQETIDQIGDFAQQINNLEKKLQGSEQEVDHLHKNLTNSRNELDATKWENRKLLNALEGSEQEVEHLHKNLKISRDDLNATKQKNRELTAEVKKAEEAIEELEAKNVLTEANLKKVKAEFEQAKTKLAETEAKAKALSDRVNQLEEEVKNLKARNAELQQKNDDLTSKIDSLNDENDSLNNDLSTSLGLNIFFGVLSAIAAIIGIGSFLKPVFEKFFHRR
ncbi:hypothetical protein [Corynebacterium silvaticum]|uniref:Uncharacterized protein n=1 Tax=Corynebacterium silvaticum TaxID=2320431 RepID=A0A7Y4P8G5_9CORY|nr:hypothetical protein [Corynebacterium silvaticum]ARU46844.1 hypothetical protein CBE74_10750 [Corynebacterium silvaticum]MBH5300765.1 hypothetical protein [Corynebacterium silvaticum]NOM64962.1 hypothetical protein [Corynebacterium silvaticum]NON70157.1 hypothetical protein [Corynebacterium silvaticum]TFA91874.1 hypothetical protein EU802_08965 [Corynebacterium silvaticum]